MDHDYSLRIQRFAQRNIPVAVLFTIKRRSSFAYVYGLSFIIFALIYYKIFCFSKQEGELLQYFMYALAFTLLTIYFYKFLCFIKEESLLVTVPLNVQHTKTNRLGHTCVNYIPWKSIKDFAVIEVIRGQKVIFYLALLLKTKALETNEHIILFSETKPRLRHLEVIYREAQILIDRCR